jgi:hypothetical protein
MNTADQQLAGWLAHKWLVKTPTTHAWCGDGMLSMAAVRHRKRQYSTVKGRQLGTCVRA